MSIDQRLAELGITLPQPAAPVAAYVPAVELGGLLHISGQISFAEDGTLIKGRLGDDVLGTASRWGRRLTVPGGDAVLITAGLLSLLVVRAGRTYLVAGLVDEPLLRRVAADLAGGTA